MCSISVNVKKKSYKSLISWNRLLLLCPICWVAGEGKTTHFIFMFWDSSKLVRYFSALCEFEVPFCQDRITNCAAGRTGRFSGSLKDVICLPLIQSTGLIDVIFSTDIPPRGSILTLLMHWLFIWSPHGSHLWYWVKCLNNYLLDRHQVSTLVCIS